MSASLHFIEKKTGKMIAKRYLLDHIPRIGEECRFHGEMYFKVVQVVNVFDENGDQYRVNIGLAKV